MLCRIVDAAPTRLRRRSIAQTAHPRTKALPWMSMRTWLRSPSDTFCKGLKGAELTEAVVCAVSLRLRSWK